MTTPRCCWPDCTDLPLADFPLCGAHANEAHWRVYDDKAAARKAAGSVPAHKQHGVVYYLLVGDRIKVGWTGDLDQRLRAYPPGSKLLAAELGTRADELDMHRRCTPFRVAGREWYAPSEAMMRVAQEAKDRQAVRTEADRIERIRNFPPRPPQPAGNKASQRRPHAHP